MRTDVPLLATTTRVRLVDAPDVTGVVVRREYLRGQIYYAVRGETGVGLCAQTAVEPVDDRVRAGWWRDWAVLDRRRCRRAQRVAWLAGAAVALDVVVHLLGGWL